MPPRPVLSGPRSIIIGRRAIPHRVSLNRRYQSQNICGRIQKMKNTFFVLRLYLNIKFVFKKWFFGFSKKIESIIFYFRTTVLLHKTFCDWYLRFRDKNIFGDEVWTLGERTGMFLLEVGGLHQREGELQRATSGIPDSTHAGRCGAPCRATAHVALLRAPAYLLPGLTRQTRSFRCSLVYFIRQC